MKKNLLTLVFSLAVLAVFAQKNILTENFEGGKLPAGWKVESKAVDGGWRFGKVAALRSNGFSLAGNTTSFVAVNDDKADQDHSNDLLISPKMNFSGSKTVFFSANFFFGEQEDQGTPENTYLLVSTDGGTKWDQVGEVKRSLNEAGTGLTWTTQAFDLTSYAKDTAVWIAVKFTDNDGYLYGVGVDDIKISEPAAIAATMKVLPSKKYALASDKQEVKVNVANQGANTITEVELTYKVGTTTETKIIKGLNIAPFGKADVTHPTLYSFPSTGEFTFDVNLTKANGADLTGTGSFKRVVISKNIDRKVVWEQGTGTWCGWCPRGHVYMDSLAKEFPKEFIGVAVHNGDPMTVAAYNTGITSTPGFTGFPSVVIDRSKVINPDKMFDSFDQARAELNPFTLEQKVTYDVATRALKVDLKTKASMTVKGDYRFAVILTEDGVKGLTSQFNQSNFYSSTAANIDLIFGNVNWKDLPNPVPAKDMVYDHVGRALLGGFAGTLNSIPADVVEGTEYAYSYTYTIPATMKPENMKVIGVIVDNQSRAIMNGTSNPVLKVPGVGVNDILDNEAVNVYPNPVVDQAVVEVTTSENTEVSMRVSNAMGQVVASRDYGKLTGKNNLTFNSSDYPSGVYTIQVKMGEKMAVKKITIQH